MKAYGSNQKYNILIMELLGPSLDILFYDSNKKFSLKTTLLLALQMIDRIEYVHSKKLIHRDIKPDNFAIGNDEKSHILYIIDFGLAKKYWSSTNKCHIPFIKGKSLTGTARYSSINAMEGCEQSRRDDLESIGYLMVYFVKGQLPWQGFKAANKEERYRKIYEKKKSTSNSELCDGLPTEFEIFINYAKNLGFTDVPNYDYLRQLLNSVIAKNKICVDYYYDWDEKKPNIDKNDIIYTNNYHIEYNGKKEWLNRYHNKCANNKNYYTNGNLNNNQNNIYIYNRIDLSKYKMVSLNKANRVVSPNNANLNYLNYKKVSNYSYSETKVTSTNYSSDKKRNYVYSNK